MDVSDSTLRTVLEGSKQYLVPLYQRPYAWKISNWEKLWDDLVDLMQRRDSDARATHFTGTLVLESGEVGPELTEFLIVDGQQRLTTLSLMLSALASYHDDQGAIESAQRIRDQFLINGYAKDFSRKYKIKPANFDNEVFTSAVEGSVRKTSDSTVDEAFLFFKRKIQKSLVDGLTADHLESSILTGLKFVTITTKNDDNVYRIFESINNTGIALTQADLIRNLVFMRLSENGDYVHNSIWIPLQKSLDAESMESLFWIDAQWRNPESRKLDTYEHQKKHIQGLSQEHLLDYLKNALKIANAMRRFQSADIMSSDKLERTLGRLHKLKLPATQVLIIRVAYLLETGTIDAATAAKALGVLESFLIRRSIAGVPVNSLGGILASCAFGLSGNADERIHAFLSTGRRRYVTDDEIREVLRTSPIYNRGRRQHLQLLLEWVLGEAQVKDAIDFSKMTIEHVLPQTLSADARKEFNKTLGPGQDTDEIHGELVNKIGNLTLTNYNSEMGNKPFSKKSKEWLTNTSVIENQNLARNKHWGADEINSRCDRVAELVCKLWIGPDESLIDKEPTTSGQRIDGLVSKIPPGKWASYGDIAAVVGTSNQSVGTRLASSASSGAWRVLRVNGKIAPGFRWEAGSEHDGKDPQSLLELEGVEFDSDSAASPEQRISVEELVELFESETD